ncbi:metallophosphoesterase family protein [Lactobacillus corticis]|uniref:Phosphoesterase n=1 Tax=Lactobacillus corticis TaxID=2201249 RepID=A0A916QG32_9LACO|nr:DNA repair exonuclease [Lactobacillus corticis]GFZ26645.1 phosphoesterase [Lactobacillus corticis]
MKFLHLADAHLDSPFLGLSFLPSKAFDQIYQASDQSFEKLIDLAVNEQVDLVLIAGDTFDSSRPSPRSQLFFAQQIARLTEHQIQTVMIFGNHDHMRASDLLVKPSPYFKLLGDGEEIEKTSFTTKDGFAYDVVGFSYLNNHITEDLVSRFPEKTPGVYTFGLAHMQEAASQNVYAPFTMSELQDLNYDYFALGHIHKRQILSQEPWVVYPGNIQGRHIKETGPKGAYLGQVAPDGITTIDFVATSQIDWEAKELLLDHELGKASLEEKILSLLTADKPTYFSLTLRGAQYLTAEEKQLLQDTDYWQALSRQLPPKCLLVDVRFEISQEIAINAADQAAFEQAQDEVLTADYLTRLAQDWAKKDPAAADLLKDPAFIQTVFDQAKVQVMAKLKGIDDETETD